MNCNGKRVCEANDIRFSLELGGTLAFLPPADRCEAIIAGLLERCADDLTPHGRASLARRLTRDLATLERYVNDARQGGQV